MRITQIQALRALAAILVVLFHADFIPGGFIGVDIFYVISGYLITGLILREIQTHGRLNFRSFYQRRIKRLLPTSFFILIVTAFLSWILLPPISRTDLGRDIAGASLYVSNYLFAYWQNDYQNLNATPSPVIHYWSLAVEEQFYLFWPLIVAVLARGGMQRVRNGILLITGGSFFLSLFATENFPIWSFYSLPTRAWELGIGALLLFIPKDFLKRKSVANVGVAVLIGSSIFFSNDSPFPGYRALFPTLATLAILGSIGAWPKLFNALGNHPIAQRLGDISYPLYLWHWPVLVLPATSLGRRLTEYEALLCIALTVVLADLTHRFIEEPLRHRKFTLSRIYTGAASVTLFSCLLGLVISQTASDSIRVDGASNSTFSLSTVSRKPITNIDGCHLSHREINFGECSYGAIDSNRTIVLFGDSHAAQWFPALEKIALQENYRLVSLTKSSCPAFALKRSNEGSYIDSICKSWRASAIRRIVDERPIAVVLGSLEYYKPPSSDLATSSWWLQGQEDLMRQLKPSGAKIVAIRDTPHPTEDIPQCLSVRSAARCSTAPKKPLPIIASLPSIDPTSWLCTSTCPAVVNGVIAYRDNSHLSVDMSRDLSKSLFDALENLDALQSSGT